MLIKSYSYGFNGMESDDEIKGAKNSYDFGARMYDPRLGRWMSVDPVQQPNQSPYIYVDNNPIIYVDKEGEDNVIYLVVLPSADSKLSATDVQDIVKQANDNFRTFGHQTRVVLYTGSDPFSKGNLDPSDSYAVIGKTSDVTEYINKQEGKTEIGKWDAWSMTGGHNPEKSSRGGRAIGVSTSFIGEFSKAIKETKVSSVAFLINHGRAHNAETWSTDATKIHAQAKGGHVGGLATAGKNIKKGANTFEFMLSPDNSTNKNYVLPSFKKTFGEAAARDNYNYNKAGEGKKNPETIKDPVQ